MPDLAAMLETTESDIVKKVQSTIRELSYIQVKVTNQKAKGMLHGMIEDFEAFEAKLTNLTFPPLKKEAAFCQQAKINLRKRCENYEKRIATMTSAKTKTTGDTACTAPGKATAATAKVDKPSTAKVDKSTTRSSTPDNPDKNLDETGLFNAFFR